MHKKQAVFVGIGLVAWCVIALMPVSTAMASGARPNIVLILADDLGWTGLGCYGSTIQLFDTASDIGETVNRQADKPELAASLNTAAMQWLDDLDAPRMTANPEYVPQGPKNRN
jgi:hypothetical protein